MYKSSKIKTEPEKGQKTSNNSVEIAESRKCDSSEVNGGIDPALSQRSDTVRDKYGNTDSHRKSDTA